MLSQVRLFFNVEFGQMYSWGEDDEKIGILGLSDNVKVTQPTLNKHVENVKICDLSLGQHHCCAIDLEGDIYTWGSGEKGELGQDSFFISNIPKKINIGHKVKKAVCGYRCTAFINMSNHLVFIGQIVNEKNFLNDLRMNLSQTHQSTIINTFEDIYVNSLDFGKYFIVLLDNKGGLYFFNEREKLCKFKIDLFINQIKCVDNSVYALGKDNETDILVELKNIRNKECISFNDFEETKYNFLFKNSEINFLPSSYYQNILFFFFKVNAFEDLILLNCKKSLLKPFDFSNKRKKYTTNEGFIKKHKDNLFGCVLPPNSKRKKSEGIEILTPDYKSTFRNERIQKISNLLGKVLNQKIEKIEENYKTKKNIITDRNSYSRRASVEKIKNSNLKSGPMTENKNPFAHLNVKDLEEKCNKKREMLEAINKADQNKPSLDLISNPISKSTIKKELDKTETKSTTVIPSSHYVSKINLKNQDELNYIPKPPESTRVNINKNLNKTKENSETNKHFNFNKRTFNENSLDSNEYDEEKEYRPRRIETGLNKHRFSNSTNKASITFLQKKFDSSKLKVCKSRENSVSYTKEGISRGNSNTSRNTKKALSVCKNSKDDVIIIGKPELLQDKKVTDTNNVIGLQVYKKPILKRNLSISINKKSFKTTNNSDKISSNKRNEQMSMLPTFDKDTYASEPKESNNLLSNTNKEKVVEFTECRGKKESNLQSEKLTQEKDIPKSMPPPKPKSRRSSMLMTNYNYNKHQVVEVPPFEIEELDSTIKKNDSNLDVNSITGGKIHTNIQKGRIIKDRYESTSNKSANTPMDYSIEYDIGLLEGKNSETQSVSPPNKLPNKKSSLNTEKLKQPEDDEKIRDRIIKNLEMFKLSNVKDKIENLIQKNHGNIKSTCSSPNCLSPYKYDNNLARSRYEPIELEKSNSVTISNQFDKFSSRVNIISKHASVIHTEGNIKTESNNYNYSLNNSIKKIQNIKRGNSIRAATNSRNKEENCYNLKFDTMKERIESKLLLNTNMTSYKSSTRDTTRDSNKNTFFRSNSYKKEPVDKRTSQDKHVRSMNSNLFDFLK